MSFSLTDYTELIARPMFNEKGPDIQTKLQRSQLMGESLPTRRPSVKNKGSFAEMQEYFCTLEELEILLKTNFINGLSEKEANQRHIDKGPNVLEMDSDWKIFLKEINLFTCVMVLAALISAGLASYGYATSAFYRTETMTFALLIIVILLTIIMGFQQRKKSKSALKKDYGTISTVIRDGQTLQIDVGKLVPGDLFEIIEGTLIPADIRVIESRDLQIQISEDSNNIVQATKTSQIFQGCLVRSGAGRGVVIKIGSNTTRAQIQTKKQHRQLQRQLFWFQVILCSLVLLLVFIVMIWAAINWDIRVEEGFKTTVQIIIALIPETALVIVTISFQMATRRMAKLNILIKNQETIEKLSEVNCFCLGLNQVITSNKYSFNSFYDTQQLFYRLLSNDQSILLMKCALLTCNQSFDDPTEKAISKVFRQFEESTQLQRTTSYFVSQTGVQFNIPFNNSKKYSLSVVIENQQQIIYVKGAPEIVWSFCKKTIHNNINDDIQQQFQTNLFTQSKKGLRSIGFAYQILENGDDLRYNDYGYDFNMENFIYIGTMYLNVKICQQAPQIIDKFKQYNIKMVVVTGEHPETAKYICQQSKLFENPYVVEGNQLYLNVDDTNEVKRLSGIDFKLRKWCEKDQIIFARTSPEQTLAIVKALQSLNYTVAVTGEGLTDLGSFKQADISVSKKYGSQQMCIKTSDIVLTSQKQTFLNFFSAIEESKRAVNNVLKAIMFILSSNTAMTFALLSYLVLGTPLLLSQNLMLLISITVDLIIGICIAREELETKSQRKIYLILFSCMVIGIIESAGGLLTAYSTLTQFGFTFDSIKYTRFQQGYTAQDATTYQAFEINLGNPNLPENCTPNYIYQNISINFEWSSYEMSKFNQQYVFVECTECTKIQKDKNAAYLGKCWNPIRSYGPCGVSGKLIEHCYTGKANYFAQNSFYAFLVIAQCINYFAMRTHVLSFSFQKINDVAIFCIAICVTSIIVVTYTPGIQQIFETAPLAWDMLGSTGLPFCIMIIVIAEMHKFLIRKYVQ